MQEESPEKFYYPPEQAYVPQMVSPEFQQPNWMMMPQAPYAFCQPCQPVHHPCGCPSHGFHGGGQHEMYPNYMMPMQMMPMHNEPDADESNADEPNADFTCTNISCASTTCTDVSDANVSDEHAAIPL